MRFSYNGNTPPVPPANKIPIANAGKDTTIVLPVNTVNLDGSASLDPDGSITGYIWKNISGPSQYNLVNAGTSTTTVNNLVQGIYEFQLTVTDNNGATINRYGIDNG